MLAIRASMVYNESMKRTLHITTCPLPKTWGNGKCRVAVMDGKKTIHTVFGVNFGLAITNIMQEWGCSRLSYSPLARAKFLGNSS